ncbi:hypothetical protein Micbo1qcDRAFT_174670 [Microdochium bolleyi]|uniref:Uncharacterized protein n=1 Tax=Microdochium bolleyi TaxID=196109 RepID=A0A136J383_9PEZI|nr:hypothetical protein Micbo1qcDRAFT_174670 [Microdochium bolleyi]
MRGHATTTTTTTTTKRPLETLAPDSPRPAPLPSQLRSTARHSGHPSTRPARFTRLPLSASASELDSIGNKDDRVNPYAGADAQGLALPKHQPMGKLMVAQVPNHDVADSCTFRSRIEHLIGAACEISPIYTSPLKLAESSPSSVAAQAYLQRLLRAPPMHIDPAFAADRWPGPFTEADPNRFLPGSIVRVQTAWGLLV